MACVRPQPTLTPADRDLALYAQSLGWLRLAGWYALELSTSVQAPYSTGAALTDQMIHSLVDVGLIEIDAVAGPGVRRALYEPKVWRYRCELGAPRRLPPILRTALTDLRLHGGSREAQRELWEALADAEIETYLAHLLRRHALDPAHASAIALAMLADWSEHTVARRRYLAWCGIRGAAAALLRSNYDHELAHRVMLDEMRRRSRWLAAKAASGELSQGDYSFMPDGHWKRPILLEVLVSTVLPDAATYWTALPERFLCVSPSSASTCR